MWYSVELVMGRCGFGGFPRVSVRHSHLMDVNVQLVFFYLMVRSSVTYCSWQLAFNSLELLVGKRLCCGYSDGTVRVWDLKNTTQTCSLSQFIHYFTLIKV